MVCYHKFRIWQLKITTKYEIPAYVLADTTWGTCDLNTTGSKILGAEIQFNIGHTINTESLEKKFSFN